MRFVYSLLGLKLLRSGGKEVPPTPGTGRAPLTGEINLLLLGKKGEEGEGQSDLPASAILR